MSALAVGCGSSAGSHATADQATTTLAAVVLPIQVTSFTASGRTVSADFQIDAGSGPVRFAWSKFVVTSPSGDTYTAYRDPGSQDTEVRTRTYVSGGIFEVGEIEPGEWSVSYDGKVLATETF